MSITIPPGTATDVVLSSNADEAAAVDAVRQHHAELAGRLGMHVDALLKAAGSAGDDVEPARTAAIGFLRAELLGHAAAEEGSLYPAAAATPRLRLLVESLRTQHRALADLVEELAGTADPVRTAAAGYALSTLVDVHLSTTDELLLPAAAADPATSLAGMQSLLSAAPAADVAREPAAHAHGACGCGDADDDVPVLDARDVPHAIRHATVFGAFDAVPIGGSLVLIAPHDPLPLLRQLDKRVGGGLAVDYEERGPEAWRLRLTRV